MGMEFIDIIMEMFIKDNGKMMSKVAKVYINLPMELYIKDSLLLEDHMVKELSNMFRYNLMILLVIAVPGLMDNQMVMEKQFIITAMYMKVIFKEEKDKEMDHILLIKFIDM